MAETVENLPAPPKPNEDSTQDRRLWIGNVDTKITEFALLKVLQKYGTLEKIDFLYQLAGPDKGKPRGYCFATYATIKEAERAQRGLNGKKALSKRLIVKPALQDRESQPQTSHSNVASSSSQPPRSTQSQISEIEARLRKLERTEGTDVDAFLPASKKRSTQNPLSHCLESTQKTDTRVYTKTKHSGGSHRDRKPYHKHRS